MTAGLYAGWLGVTVLVPILFPFLAIWVGKRLVEIDATKKPYRSAVKDGQLLWIAISLAAAALFEIAEGHSKLALAWPLGICFGFGGLVCAMSISVWTVVGLAANNKDGSLKPKEGTLISMSVWLLLAIAGGYAVVKLLLL